MTAAAARFLTDFLKSHSGLCLSADKTYLLESRLLPIARERGLGDLASLVMALKRGDQGLSRAVIDAMTTNETQFFRDIRPFDAFRKVVRTLRDARRQSRMIRIWSAAASTGQEAYSLAMLLCEEAGGLDGWKITILGTDISERALQKARDGIYSQFEVQRGMPTPLLLKYFVNVGDNWQIRPEIRAMAEFRTYNLLYDLRPLGTFDVVFCRNVLIYFDQAARNQTLHKLAAQMPADGFLFLGGAECIMTPAEGFRPLPELPGVYAPAGPGVPAFAPAQPAPAFPGARVAGST